MIIRTTHPLHRQSSLTTLEMYSIDCKSIERDGDDYDDDDDHIDDDGHPQHHQQSS